ncbi:MAG TPA: methyl-accepting chemotaxis protein, partial [Myxococcota bacterium]|nr:methyl-accepting chemotaxis protein [Myxococcota bacterium]
AAQIETISRMVVREAREGQRGSVEQSSAVAQTRSAMQSLLATGRNIMQAAQEVLHNAELTHRNNDLVAERIADLAGHARRIIEILEAIRAVANKSDLLALNAALQGLRAGSAGRGFTVVATQMQQLAERIMAAVADIQELTGVIREASLITEASNTEAARLASHTTLSARQISAFIAEQQSGTEQVSQAMEDIADVAQNAAQVGNLTLEGVQNLLQHADHLRAIASAFGGSNDLAALSHLEGQDAYVDGDDPPERPGPPGTGRGGHDAEHKERK